MTAVFFVAFLSFVQFAISSRYAISRIFAILMAINVLVFDRYFVWKYSYADSSAGIAFALAVALGVLTLEAQARSSPQRFGLILAFLIVSAMSVALKVSSALIVIWALYVFFMAAKKAGESPFHLARIAVLPAIFAFGWTLRGVIVSGCLLFPASWSCVDVPWNAEQEAISQANWVTAWARHPSAGLYSLEGWSWISNYWLEASTNLLVWLAIAALATFCVAIVFRRYLTAERLPRLDALVLIIVVVAALSLWFLKAPSDRFGIGVFMVAAPLFAISVLGAPIFVPGLKTRALSILLIVLLANNQGGFSIKGLMRFHLLTVPVVETIPDANFGVRPKSGGGDCWTATHCAPGNRPTPTEKSGYLFFEMPSDQHTSAR
ncbi:hypothetical protein [Roseibium sp. MMSF_3544]|nr:hypothetical protein [Roseibium sp. MMSF_3544]